MGCCISTDKHSPANPPVPESDTTHVINTSNRDPPPLVEEETVKEVLSETPIPKPLTPMMVQAHNNKPEARDVKAQVKAVLPQEVSGVSESFSTTSFTDRREDEDDEDDDGEVRQRVRTSPAKVPRKRPCSGELAGGKERRVRSPATRSKSSPETKNRIVSRSVQERESSHVTATKRRNMGSNGLRRDSGDSSVRRSRPPVTRTVGVATRSVTGETSSLSTTGRSPAPATAAAVHNGAKLEKSNDDVLASTNESLENPLVSLECFIFL